MDDPANGTVTWTSLTTGGVAAYACDPGFELVGEMTRNCMRNSEWSGEAPTCEPIRTCAIISIMIVLYMHYTCIVLFYICMHTI